MVNVKRAHTHSSFCIKKEKIGGKPPTVSYESSKIKVFFGIFFILGTVELTRTADGFE